MQKMPMIRTVYTRENPDYADAASGAAGASFQAGNTQKLKTSNKYRKHRRANRRAVHRAHKHR